MYSINCRLLKKNGTHLNGSHGGRGPSASALVGFPLAAVRYLHCAYRLGAGHETAIVLVAGHSGKNQKESNDRSSLTQQHTHMSSRCALINTRSP